MPLGASPAWCWKRASSVSCTWAGHDAQRPPSTTSLQRCLSRSSQIRVRAPIGSRFQTMNVGFRIPSAVEAEPAERTFDMRQYMHFVWRHWMFIASVTALVFVIGVVYLARTTPLYTATAQVLLERPARAPTDTGSTDSGFGDYSFIENQLAIIRSDPLLRRVVVKERLAEPRPAANEPQSTDACKESPAGAEEQSILGAINSL